MTEEAKETRSDQSQKHLNLRSLRPPLRLCGETSSCSEETGNYQAGIDAATAAGAPT